MIKTITFDFGGVLYYYDGEKLLRQFASRSESTLDELKELMEESELERAHFRGEIKAEELLNILNNRIGLEMNVEGLAQAYKDSLKPNSKMFELVRELNGNYNLQLYSDTPKILYERLMTDMPIFDMFSAVTLSFKVGQLKDSPEGHREVIEKSGHSPEEIIFIDDRDDFVDQAKELGINGIKFTGMGKLTKDLARLGVELNGKFEV